MRKKYHTLEEVRQAAAERARRWREKNKVLARERVAYNYGKARYPEMVEAAQAKRPETPPFVINALSMRDKEALEVEEELQRVPIDEVEGDRKVMRQHQERMQKFRPPGGVPVKESPPKEVVSQKHLEAVERLAEIVSRRAKGQTREVEVPFEG
jgi:hypothetical protein